MTIKKWLAAPILIVAVVASYLPALHNGFVWDDTALVLRDPLIRSWRLIPEGFNHYLFVDATASNFYRPLQRLTYTAEYALFGFQPGPYHFTNILLHAAAAVALLLLGNEILAAFGCDRRKAGWIALIAAFVWAIHPVQSAAVVYVSGRADPLAAFFGFTGCYLALRSVGRVGSARFIFLVGSGLGFLSAALSKETGLIFPLLMIVLFILLKNRRAAAQLMVVGAFVWVSYLSLRLPAEHDPVPVLGPRTPLAVRPITTARAVAEYAGLILLPLNLHMDRDVQNSVVRHPSADSAARRELQTLAGLCLIGAAIYLTIRARRRSPAVFALLVVTAVSYLPVCGIFALNASVAEHWIYVPSAFLFLAAAVVAANQLQAIRFPKIACIATAVALACWTLFLGTRTFIRNFDWKDQRTFLERTIASGGDSARMLINLGGLELREGHLDLAKKHLEAALRRRPEQPLAIINLAAVALKENDLEAARELLTRAIHMPLVAAQAHELLAVLENKESGRADLLRLRLAAHTGPPNWSIEKRYVNVLDETGATTRAANELAVCLRSEWYRAESWQLLGQLLAKSGHPKQAAEALTQAHAYDVHLDQVRTLF